MKLKLIIFLCLISMISFGQNDSFSYLKKLELDKNWGAYLKYNSTTTEVFNKQFKDLDKTDPFYTDFEEAQFDIKAIKTKIDNSSKDEYFVVYSFGPSADPSFFFYKADTFEKIAFRVPGLRLYIPGNGSIYVSGHTNNNFNVRKKYQLKDSKLTEIQQPYYYVGLKTKTLTPIKIYDSKKLENVTANLPVNYKIEVLLSENDNSSLFLIRTEFGLIGWIDLGYIGQKPDKIDKIFFNGD